MEENAKVCPPLSAEPSREDGIRENSGQTTLEPESEKDAPAESTPKTATTTSAEQETRTESEEIPVPTSTNIESIRTKSTIEIDLQAAQDVPVEPDVLILEDANQSVPIEGEELPPELAEEPPPAPEPTDDIGGALCVFYTRSPLSDFTPSPFILDGKYYYSVEHFFQIQMLYSFGLFRLACELIKIEDAHEFRRKLRDELRGLIKTGLFDEKMFGKWKIANADRMFRRGNKAKFEQNFALRQLLLHTGDRLLVFTNRRDRLLGVGMTESEFLFWIKKNQIRLEDLLDMFAGARHRPRELGGNVLGLALMEVRAELANKTSILSEWRHHQTSESAAEQSSATTVPPPKTQPVTEKEANEMKTIQDSIVGIASLESRNRICNPASKAEAKRQKARQSDLLGEFLRKQREALLPTNANTTAANNEDVSSAKDILPSTSAAITLCLSGGSTTSEKENEGKDALGEIAGTSGATDQVVVIRSERRIVVKRKGVQPKAAIGGSDDPEVQRRTGEKRAKGSDDTLTSTPSAGKDSVDGGGSTKIADDHSTATRPPRGVTRWGDTADKWTPGGTVWNDATKDDVTTAKLSRNEAVLARLRALRFERPMINPYTLTTFDGTLLELHAPPAEHDETEKSGVTETTVVEETKKPGWWRARIKGTAYSLEAGEIPPSGVIPPPPGVNEPAILLPLHKRQWIIRPPPGATWARPAGLPAHLLPIPPCPAGVDPNLWRQRFPKHLFPVHPVPRAPQEGLRDAPFIRARRPPIVRAPETDEAPDIWQMPDNIVLKALRKAKNFVGDVRERHRRRMAGGKGRRYVSDEGSDPKSARRAEAKLTDVETAADDEVIALDPFVFPFGMEAGLDDLQRLGFVPPPIVGDPEAQIRNKRVRIPDWLLRFESFEAALHYYASRWRKGGRLSNVGKFEECDSSDEEEDTPTNYALADQQQEEHRPKRTFETQIVYVDTGRYNRYVEWYQKTHGFAPIPEDERHVQLEQLRGWFQHYRTQVQINQANEEKQAPAGLPTDGSQVATTSATERATTKTEEDSSLLYPNSFGDYWALSRWKWAEWERRLNRDDGGAFLQLKQETEQDDCSYSAKPLRYDPSKVKREAEDDVEFIEEFPNHLSNPAPATSSTTELVPDSDDIIMVDRGLQAAIPTTNSDQDEEVILLPTAPPSTDMDQESSSDLAFIPRSVKLVPTPNRGNVSAERNRPNVTGETSAVFIGPMIPGQDLANQQRPSTSSASNEQEVVETVEVERQEESVSSPAPQVMDLTV